MSDSCPLLKLPDDAILIILSYINNVREKMRLKRGEISSSSSSSLSSSTFSFNYFIFLTNCQQFKFCFFPFHLPLLIIVCKRLSVLAPLATKIQHYSLTCASNFFYPNENLSDFKPIPIDNLLRVAPKLAAIRQDESSDNVFYKLIDWSECESGLTSLRHLSLDASANFETLIDFIIDKSINLNYLELDCYKGDVENIKPSLHTLHLKSTFVSLQSIKDYIIAKGSNLRNLIYDVPNCFLSVEVDESILDLLAVHSPNIESLEINNVKLCKFDFIPLINLISLKITGLSLLALICELLIVKCPALQNFKFECCRHELPLIELLQTKYAHRVKFDYLVRHPSVPALVINM